MNVVTEKVTNQFLKDIVHAEIIKAGVFTAPTIVLKSTFECLIEPDVKYSKEKTLETINENILQNIQIKETRVEEVDDSIVVYHNDGQSIYMVQFFPSKEVRFWYEQYKEEGFTFTMCHELGEHFGLYFFRPKWSSRGGKAYFPNN